jgi:hypothetical protein
MLILQVCWQSASILAHILDYFRKYFWKYFAEYFSRAANTLPLTRENISARIFGNIRARTFEDTCRYARREYFHFSFQQGRTAIPETPTRCGNDARASTKKSVSNAQSVSRKYCTHVSRRASA